MCLPQNCAESFEKYNVKLSNVLANTKLLSALTEDEPITDFPYSSLVGSLNWLTKTRSEISFAVLQCSCYLHNHAQHHDEAALKVLGYLKKNPNLGLCFPKSHFNKEKLFIDVYADLSNANCLDDQKSSYGYTLRANGRPLSWCSKKSPQVCLSSCEAEYHAMSECAWEIKFAKNLLKDLELPSNDVVPMQVDSKPATAIAEIPKVTQGNKYFDVCDHFICDAIDDKVLKIDQTPSAENIADIFTKPLPPAKFIPFRESFVALFPLLLLDLSCSLLLHFVLI